MKKRILFFICSFLFISSVGYAQESLITAGGIGAGVNGTVSYSIGQVFYEIDGEHNGGLSQGIQVPYEIYDNTPVGVSDDRINLSVASYPNPVTDILTLDITGDIDLSRSSHTFFLYNMRGELLVSGKIADQKTTIDMGRFASATYVLKVMKEDNLLKSFIIIKK